MLQMMLADRFHLRFHWETHQEPVYLLVADKKGVKLKATDPGSCVPVPPEVTLTPNRTEHEGMVDIKLDFTLANQLSTDPADGPPSIFDALPGTAGA